MKLTVGILIVLGVLASICAAVIVRVFSAQDDRALLVPKEPEVEVMVAVHRLAGMSVVSAGDVQVKSVPASKAPPDSLTNSVEIVGKVLTIPMVEGQVFTRTCFAGQGTGLYLASVLPEGKRAVTISLGSDSGLEGLLYAGSVVDVLASFRPTTASRNNGELLSTTLLQNVQVLAVGSQTVVSTEESLADKAERRGGSRNRLLVTLLVDPKQAEALKLATENGSVSLAMRNPLDSERLAQGGTTMADLSGLDDAYRNMPPVSIFDIPVVETEPEREPEPEVEVQPEAAPSPPAPRPEPPPWETTIFRGGVKESQVFPQPEPEPEPVAAAGAVVGQVGPVLAEP